MQIDSFRFIVMDMRLKKPYLYPWSKIFFWLFTASRTSITIVNCLLLVWTVNGRFLKFALQSSVFQKKKNLSKVEWIVILFVFISLFHGRARFGLHDRVQPFMIYFITSNLSSSISIKISCLLKSTMCLTLCAVVIACM